jgi:hypothetical protein
MCCGVAVDVDSIRAMRRPRGRIILAIVFALLAAGAWLELLENFRNHSSVEIEILHALIAASATAVVVGSWSMARWAPIAAVLYGVVSAALLWSLTRLLGLDASASGGLRIGAVVVFAFSICAAWYLRRSSRQPTAEQGAG